jgi:hypothetical protein
MGLSRVVGWRDPSVKRAQLQAAGALANEVRTVEAVIPWGSQVPTSLVPRLVELAGLPA